MRKGKRFLSIWMAVVMAAAMVPSGRPAAVVYAEETSAEQELLTDISLAEDGTEKTLTEAADAEANAMEEGTAEKESTEEPDAETNATEEETEEKEPAEEPGDAGQTETGDTEQGTEEAPSASENGTAKPEESGDKPAESEEAAGDVSEGADQAAVSEESEQAPEENGTILQEGDETAASESLTEETDIQLEEQAMELQSLLAASSTDPVQNPELDLADGGIWLWEGMYFQGKSYTPNVTSGVSYTGTVTVTGSTDRYSIFVSGGTHDLILKNATVTPRALQGTELSEQEALYIQDSSVSITVEGTNTLTGSSMYTNTYAGEDGIRLGSGSSLTIRGNGTLNVNGGSSLRSATADVVGGFGLQASGGSLTVEGSVTLNIAGGEGNSAVESTQGIGVQLNNSQDLTVVGGTVNIEGYTGIRMLEGAEGIFVSGGTVSVSGYYWSIRYADEAGRGSVEVGGGSLALQSKESSVLRNIDLTVIGDGGQVTAQTGGYTLINNTTVTVRPVSRTGVFAVGTSEETATAQRVEAEKSYTNISDGNRYMKIYFPEDSETCSLTIQDGGEGASGAGSYAPGVTVPISAGTKENAVFDHWEIVSGGGSLDDASQAETTFTMGIREAALQPVFSDTYALTVEEGAIQGTDNTRFVSGNQVKIKANDRRGG